jgi:hypothetical protein
MRLRDRIWGLSRFVLPAAVLIFAGLEQVPLGLAPAQAQTTGSRYVVFDVPGANLTIPIGEAQPGVIMGYFYDANWAIHGFLRYPNGRYATIDVQGAAATLPRGANAWGVICGRYMDANGTRHGFLRTPNGTFTLFDVKHAGSGDGQGTFAGSINLAGRVGGQDIDAANVCHGFVRDPGGRITPFDARDAGNAPGLGTFTGPYKYLNTSGEFTGWYLDVNGVYYGFLRFPDGRINEIDAPGAGHSNATGSGQGTQPSAINDAGVIVGVYQDSNDGMHSFLRFANGKFIEIADPDALIGFAWSGTYALDINDLGEIAGSYYDANWMYHGFLRTPFGRFVTVDPPGSDETDVMSVTSTGVVVGYYWDDSAGRYRGFLCFPGAGGN